MRSRFHVALLGLLTGLALAACSHHFGPGITELPAARGWQPLPIASWVLNDGLEARAMAFCPRDACDQQGFAAVVSFSGARAREVEQALSESPMALGQAFARLAAEKAAERRKARKGQKKKKDEPKPARSATDVLRLDTADTRGVLVTIRSLDTPGRQAVTAILYGREDDRLVVALAVASTADAARHDAAAAWRSR
ncbi:hypothetical protein [Bosea thiooxidans]